MSLLDHIRLHQPARPGRLLLLLAGLLWLTAVSCRPARQPTVIPNNLATDRVKLLVEQDGFVRVSQAELAAAGLEMPAFNAANLHLSQGETAVPFTIQNDALIFYGQAPTSRYTAQRAYLLSSGQAGQMMGETAVLPPTTPASLTAISRTLHLEENLVYKSEARQFLDDADPSADLWFWQPLRQGKTLPFDFNLPATADGSGQIRIQMKGETYNVEVENDHDFDIILNGQTIGTIRFDGQIYHTGSVIVPPGLLKTGANNLILDNAVEGAAFLDIMDLNWIEITYAAPPTAIHDELTITGQRGIVQLSGFSGAPDLYDTSQPEQPQRLTGLPANDPTLAVQEGQRVTAVGPTGYQSATIQPIRATTWRSPDNGADLLIITTDALIPALQPLVQARQAEGLRVAVIPTAEIYDEFGAGAASPDSIHAFVAYAYENWQPPQPQYLFLVGSATADYRNYLGLAPVNIVPAPMVPVSYSGETVSDARLADVDGDTQPDLAVGRWPVDSAAAVASLVARTLAYEDGTAVNQILFAADGTEGQFTDLAQRLVQNSGLDETSVTLLTGPTADEVVTHWNDGAWLATYVGHGSLAQWGKDNVFTLDAVNRLQNSAPPIVVQLTCLTGLFTHPEQPSLTEVMFNHATGPVLSIAATSLTLSSSQEPFAAALLTQLNDPAVSRIGDAFQTAKRTLPGATNTSLQEISDTFTLFGDPSAHIARPEHTAPPNS
ncbi:MAG: hypothetical protein IPM39_08180 [Chloroflexi bacterium]|nr:hypothetical protein [Chloroflexota bacterium]